jgi:hypothetical protein
LRLFLLPHLIYSQFVTNKGSIALYKHKLEGSKDRQKLNEATDSLSLLVSHKITSDSHNFWLIIIAKEMRK